MQNDEYIEELKAVTRMTGEKKNLLDALKIAVSESDFDKYLRLYSHPNAIKKAIDDKLLQLWEEQVKIKAKIKDNVKFTKRVITAFEKRFANFNEISLQSKAELEKMMNDKNRNYYEELFRMADKDGAGDVIWDPEYVKKFADQMA